MKSLLFTKCFLELVCSAGKEKYGSVMAFAKKLFPEKEDPKNAANTLYAIIGQSSKTGKPQALTMDIAYRMVELLETDRRFSEFCWDAENRIRNGWTLEDYEIFRESIGGNRRRDGSGAKQAKLHKGEETKELSTGTDA